MPNRSGDQAKTTKEIHYELSNMTTPCIKPGSNCKSSKPLHLEPWPHCFAQEYHTKVVTKHKPNCILHSISPWSQYIIVVCTGSLYNCTKCVHIETKNNPLITPPPRAPHSVPPHSWSFTRSHMLIYKLLTLLISLPRALIKFAKARSNISASQLIAPLNNYCVIAIISIVACN